jgi:hypothetical protein
MSTLFDPALIDTFVNRVEFMEKSITYLLGTSSAPTTALSKSAVQLFPNPANHNFSMAIDVATNQNVVLQLTDLTGRSMLQDEVALKAGKNVFTKSLVGLAPGVYIVTVKDDEGQYRYTGTLLKN